MDDQIYICIAKQLDGEATESERKQIDAWLAEHPDNIAIYNNLKLAWGKSEELFKGPDFNKDAAWTNVSARMQGDKSHTIVFPGWARYAAAAAILLLGLFIMKFYKEDSITVSANEVNLEITLPDNSHIILRKGSTLHYPAKFDARQRDVKLEGEAFFEVARNEQCPFVIDAQSAEVKVLGTSFNVKCDKEYASVVVKTGKVQMTASQNHTSLILTPGKKGSLKNNKLTEDQVLADNYLFWKTGMLNFSNTPLSEVLTEMSVIKDTAIVFSPGYPGEQKRQVINISFSNQPLEEMVAEICLITQNTWRKEGNTIILSAK